jgi:HSP20 family protein
MNMAGLTTRDFAFPSLRNWMRAFDEPFAGLAALDENLDLPIDVSENKEGQIVVRATLPGFKKEEVEVRVENGALCLTANHKEESESKSENYYRKERSWKSVNRRIALPGKPLDAGVTAELRDGVLLVKVPQAKDAQAKKIEVK